LPHEVKPGERVTAYLVLTASDLNSYLLTRKALMASLRFSQGGLLWHVEDFPLDKFPGQVSTGQSLACTHEFLLPTGLPAGAYSVEAIIYGARVEMPARTPQIRLQGPGTITDLSIVKNISHGTYVDMDGVPHQWWINRQHTLIWEGKPYIPIGGMFCSRERQRDEWVLRNMALNGVYDLYFNCTSIDAMRSYVPLLEKLGIRYGFQIEAGAWGHSMEFPMVQVRTHAEANLPAFDYVADGNAASFRIPRSGYTRNIKQILAVYYTVFTPDRSTVVETGKFASAELTPDHFAVTTTFTKLRPGERYQVVCLPIYRGKPDGFGLPNFWEKPKPYLAQVEKNIEKALGKGAFGPGFRCFLEPSLNETDITQDLESVYFVEPNLIEEYASWLQETYTTPEGLQRAWAFIGPMPASFADASRLIPLCLDAPGDGNPTRCWMMDHQTQALYAVDYTKTHAWTDYFYFRDDNYGRVVSEICDMIRQYVDAPIVQKHVSMFKRYNVNQQRVGGMDGVGFETYMDGDGSYTFHSTAATSEANSSMRTMWVPLTEGSPTNSFVDQNPYWYNRPYWVSRREMATWIDRMFDAGAKGLYTFLIQRPGGTWIGNFAQWTELYHQPIAMKWLGEVNDLANRRYARQIADFTPMQYASFPARGQFWRPDMWANFYQADACPDNMRVFKAPNGIWVAPTDFPNRIDSPVYYCNLRTRVVAERFGGEFEQLLQRGKLVIYVGFRDADGLLSIDKYFGTKFERLPDGRQAQELLPPPGAETLNTTPSGMIYGFRAGKLQIVATSIWNFTEKNPQEMDYARDDNPQVMPKPLATELPGFDLRPYRFSIFSDAYSPSDAPVMEWNPLYRPEDRSGGTYPWPSGR
jgi:hypothetical protein